jgi:hypothetical protein
MNAADQMAIEESLEEPLNAERTRKLAESWQRRHSEADALAEDEEDEDDEEEEESSEDSEEEDEVVVVEEPAVGAERPSGGGRDVVKAVPATVDEDEETATADDYKVRPKGLKKFFSNVRSSLFKATSRFFR